MNPKREEIIDLIKKNISIPKISRELQVNKSTIYYHYKKIKGRKYKLATIPKEENIIGEFLGIFAGDGNYYHDRKRGHHKIRFGLHSIDDKEYILFLKNFIEDNFQKKITFYKFKKNNGLMLIFCSKKVADFIKLYLVIEGYKTLNIRLNRPLHTFSKQFLTSFVRGLFDTDGYVKGRGAGLGLCLISKNLIEQVSEILKSFGIENNTYIRKGKENNPKYKHTQYELSIKKRYLKKYLSTIGFSNSRKNEAAKKKIEQKGF